MIQSSQPHGRSQKKYKIVALIVVMVFTILLVFSVNTVGKSVSFNELYVYYLRPVSKAEAIRVLKVLVERDFASDGLRRMVQIQKREGFFAIRYALQREAEITPDAKAMLVALAKTISIEALDSAPIEVHFCDLQFRSWQVISGKRK